MSRCVFYYPFYRRERRNNCLFVVNIDAQEKHQSDCDLPIQMGNCRATRGLMTRFFFNTTAEKCEKFGFSGCGGNENNFKDLAGCKLQCELPKIHKKVSQEDPKVIIVQADNQEVSPFRAITCLPVITKKISQGL